MVNEFDAGTIKTKVCQYATTLDCTLIDYYDYVNLRETPIRVGDQVIITATYPYQPLTPGLNLILGDTPTVQSSVTLAPYYQQ